MFPAMVRILRPLALVLLVAVAAVPLHAQEPRPQNHGSLTHYAYDTWQSFVAMTDADTGLSADNISATRERSEYTSPTNIGAYMWSTIAARDLGFITPEEATSRLTRTVQTLEGMERSVGGMYYNDIGGESSLRAALHFSGSFLVLCRCSVQPEPMSEVIVPPRYYAILVGEYGRSQERKPTRNSPPISQLVRPGNWR